MIVLAAFAASAGVFYLYTAVALGWSDLRPTPMVASSSRGPALIDQWLASNDLSGLRLRDIGAIAAAMFAAAALAIYVVFGVVVPAVAVGCFAATFPIASERVRRERKRAEAQDSWPRLLEELRIQTGSLGRSIPQALFEVGVRAPESMRPMFDAAQREWLISTDFDRTCSVFKESLADPTADAVVETLLIAHSIGGTDLDRRLAALIEDRLQDAHGRKDEQRQAGARFARRFVLVVPAGMALAGMSVGDGRAAFRTSAGQVLTSVAVAMVAACWVWAGRIMRLPDEQRTFSA